MANRTYLLGLNEDFFEEENVSLHSLVEARYCIPVLWLSLFQSNDIRLYESIPILLTTRECALGNIDQRFDGLVSFFGEPCRKLLTQWRDFIEKNAYANYLLNTMELAQMENAEGEFLNELKNYMTELDALVAGTHATRELSVVVQASQSLVEYPYVNESLPLCGYSNSLSLPWEQEQ